MDKFLEKVADEILKNYDHQDMNLAVILPNKRSEVFLKNYLKEKTNGTYWLPDFYTTDEFIIQLSGFNLLDPILIYFELYEIHKTLLDDKAMPVEDFLSWAPIMLSDFNDIDLYQADASHIFKHLTEAKAIEQWNLTSAPLTTLQSDYIAFYQSLFTYYSELKSRLSVRKLGYKGMIYRYLSENIFHFEELLKGKIFILIGFNALSTSEKEIFGYINDNFKTTFYWDVDEYYIYPEKMGLKQMEAGRFINDLIKEWQLTDIKWINSHLTTSHKEIHIHGIAKQIGQVKFAGQHLSEIEIAANSSDTAIILADENLLLPLLHSLPEKLNDDEKLHYNVTMGYPLYNSSLSRFILRWLNLIVKSGERTTRKYDTNQLIILLKNSIIKLILDDHELHLRKALTTELINSNLIFLSDEDIKNILQNYEQPSLHQFFDILLANNENNESFLNSLIEIMQWVAGAVQKMENNSNPILEAQIDVTYSIIKKVQAMLLAKGHVFGLKALQKIFNQLFRRSEINLKGEPLIGIQIMGMLETRNLDFKNIILLSANEGILPKSSDLESFIPFDIRHDNKLPLPKEQNDIFTYHFYRLLQRAENITILYNTDSDKIGSGEKSRFILQLENELAKFNESIQINQYITNIDIGDIPDEQSISIQKDDNILQLVSEKAKTGFSASALNVYRNCSLKFYFREIIKLQETNKIESDIEFNVFGNAIHKVLEEIYKPFVGKHLNPEELKKMLPKADSMLEKSFNETYKGGNIHTGKNHLIYEVAKKYIKQFLTSEIEDATTSFKQIISLEEKIEMDLNIENHEVKLKGYLDRVEMLLKDDQIRIIDYKTGKVEPKDLILKTWEEFPGKDKDKLFQLLFYAYLYQKKYQPSHSPQLGIFSLRMLSNGLIEPKLPDEKNHFEDYLINLIHELFDPSFQFIQTTDVNICSYCDYKEICNK